MTDRLLIYVGKKRKQFTVPKKLICNRINYIDKAFNGAFREGSNGAIYLPKDDPTIFDSFIAWLYRNTLQPAPMDSEILTQEAAVDYYMDLYLFAEKYGIETLQNQAIDSLSRHMIDTGRFCSLLGHIRFIVILRLSHHSADSSPRALLTLLPEVGELWIEAP